MEIQCNTCEEYRGVDEEEIKVFTNGRKIKQGLCLQCRKPVFIRWLIKEPGRRKGEVINLTI